MLPQQYRTHQFYRFWLKISAFAIWSFGPVFFLGTMIASAEPARLTLDLLSWPIDGASTYDSPDTRFLSALTGGFLMGWGITVWALSKWVYPKAPEETRKVVLLGLLTWFVFDSTGSITSGNTSNVLFNILVLLLAVGPMWWKAEA